MKKILLIIIDGLGDRPVSELGDKTPLEAAQTPNLDKLAKNGICGLVDTFKFSEEREPTSEGTHVALFGYKDYFLGRGPYEAAGVGMDMKKGDVALRVNFATVDKGLKVIDRRAGRIEKTEPLVKSLSGIKIEGVEFLIKRSFGHRGVLILRRGNLSDKITKGDPKKKGEKVKKILPLQKTKEAQFTGKVLNKYLEKTHQILKEHPFNKERKKQGLLPANYLLLRGAGKFKQTPSFKEKYGLQACCVAGGSLYKGVAKILGMDLIEVKGATGMADTNLPGKISAVRDSLKKYDFVFLHIKATDTFAHDGDFEGKKNFIEKIDRNISPTLSFKNTLIVVTADHATPCEVKNHSSDPVPILVWGEEKDKINKFDEKECVNGRLGGIKQTELMSTILEFAKN